MFAMLRWAVPQGGVFRVNPNAPGARGLLQVYNTFNEPWAYKGTRDGHGAIRQFGARTIYDPDMGLIWNFSAASAFEGIAIWDAPGLSYTTISAWIKTTSAGTEGIVGADDTGSARQFQLRISGGALQFVIFNNTGGFDSASAAGTVNDGAWTHVAGTYDGANIQCYVNGAASGSPKALAGIIKQISSGKWALGALYYNPGFDQFGYQYHGQLAEARIYGRAMSATEVYDLYHPATRWDIYESVLPPLHAVDASGRTQGPAVQMMG